MGLRLRFMGLNTIFSPCLNGLRVSVSLCGAQNVPNWNNNEQMEFIQQVPSASWTENIESLSLTAINTEQTVPFCSCFFLTDPDIIYKWKFINLFLSYIFLFFRRHNYFPWVKLQYVECVISSIATVNRTNMYEIKCGLCWWLWRMHVSARWRNDENQQPNQM